MNDIDSFGLTSQLRELFTLVIEKISFGNLPKLSRGKNQLAHRILRTQFS